jgi:hypothetical protein
MALTALTALAILAGACSDDDGPSTAPGDPAEFVSERLDLAEAAPRTTATTATTEAPQALDVTQIRGAVISQFSLEVGDCFDRLEDLDAGRPVITTTRIDCDEPHGYQIFHRFDYPAPHPALHPGDPAMREYALQSCYREFAAWVGRDYETSALEIGVITPPRENFEDDVARYRGIHCWVEPNDGDPLVGSAEGRGW